VVVGHRGEVDVVTVEGFERAPLGAAFRRLRRRDPTAVPVVGDFVVLGTRGHRGLRDVAEVLPRRTALVRKAAGRAATVQVLCANVDVVMVATALALDLNVRRLERYLALVAESGARPVFVLTKADLVAAPDAEAARIAAAFPGVPVHAISTTTGRGLEALETYFEGARTVALVGSSGVGKSTLLNAWLPAEDARATGAVREDGRGRHTTTRRELVQRPGRDGLVVDTPGIREVGMWLMEGEEMSAAQALEEAFPDVLAHAERCRFRDCRHAAEPGCAVRAACETGTLEPARVAGFLKLRDEFDALAARHRQRRRGT
jgi:ribosome biogenesis GTPase